MVNGRLETFRTVTVRTAFHSGPSARPKARVAGSTAISVVAACIGSTSPPPCDVTGSARFSRRSRPPLPTSALRRSTAVRFGRASATSAAAPATTAAAALEPVTVAKPSPPASDVARPTPGATRSGLTRPSKATPPEENGVMSMRAAFGRAWALESSSDAPPARAACAASSGMPTTGTCTLSSTSSEPAGRLVPATRTAPAPASAAWRTRRSTAPSPACTTTALPATRLTPFVPKKSPSTSPLATTPAARSDWASVGPATVATSNRAGRAGAAPPRTRTRSSSTVLAPTCSSASASNTSRRASSVPTARASAAAAGQRSCRTRARACRRSRQVRPRASRAGSPRPWRVPPGCRRRPRTAVRHQRARSRQRPRRLRRRRGRRRARARRGGDRHAPAPPSCPRSSLPSP